MKVRAALAFAPLHEHGAVACNRLMMKASVLKDPEAVLKVMKASIKNPRWCGWLEDHPSVRDTFQLMVTHEIPEAMYLQGTIEYSQKNFGRALLSFKGALKTLETLGGQPGQQSPFVHELGTSLPARIIYATSVTQMKLGNKDDAIKALHSAAVDYDDPKALRLLATITYDAGNEEDYEHHLLKAAAMRDEVASIRLAIYYSSRKRVSSGKMDRAMARHWFDVFALDDSDQLSAKVITAAGKHAEATRAARDEGFTALQEIQQELSSLEKQELTASRPKTESQALAEFTKTWKMIVASFISQWQSPGFSISDFEWPTSLGHYLPFEITDQYDLDQGNKNRQYVTRVRHGITK